MNIRGVEEGDFEAVALLIEGLGRPRLTDSNRESLRRVFDVLRLEPNTAFLVAELDGELIGTIRVQMRGRLNFADFEAWVSDFIVVEKHRSRGIGRMLLRHAIGAVGERRGVRLLLESGHHRIHAHALYLSEGFIDSGKAFTLKIEANRTD